MASFIVGSFNEVSSGTTTDTPGALSVTAGDLILIHTSHEGTLVTCTPSDDNSGGSNTYTQIRDLQHSNNDLCGYLHYAVAGTTQTLIVATNISASRSWLGFRLGVFRATASETLTLDNSAEAQGSSTAQSTGSFATTVGVGIAFTGFSEYSNGTGTPGTDWTEIAAGGDSRPWGEYRILSAESSITGDQTWSANDAWIAMGVSFTEADASPPITDGPKLVLTRSNIRLN